MTLAPTKARLINNQQRRYACDVYSDDNAVINGKYRAIKQAWRCNAMAVSNDSFSYRRQAAWVVLFYGILTRCCVVSAVGDSTPAWVSELGVTFDGWRTVPSPLV